MEEIKEVLRDVNMSASDWKALNEAIKKYAADQWAFGFDEGYEEGLENGRDRSEYS